MGRQQNPAQGSYCCCGSPTLHFLLCLPLLLHETPSAAAGCPPPQLHLQPAVRKDTKSFITAAVSLVSPLHLPPSIYPL